MLPLAMSSSEPTVPPWPTTVGCPWTSVAASVSNASVQHPSTSQSTEVTKHMWTYLGPIIFFVGLIGNVLILAVMSTKRMRGTSTSDYLVIMAVADLLAIVTGMVPDWMDALGLFVLQESHPAACKIYKFAVYSFGDMTTWIRVLFTLDRFTAICFPMSKTDCCLPQRAKFYCLGAALVAFAKNMHVFWTRGAEYETVPVFESVDCVAVKTNRTLTRLKVNCGYPRPEYRYFEAYVRPWIVFALVNLIPFCVILVCNVFIVRAMIGMKRRRHHLSTMKGGGERHLLQTTAMCLAASFTFLVCVTPTMVLLIGKPYWTVRGTNVAYDIAKSFSNQLLYANNSANFFLYCITGQKFRGTLVMILCCRCKTARKRHGDSSGEVRPGTGRKLHSTVRDVRDAASGTPRKSQVTSSSATRRAGEGEAVPEIVEEAVIEREEPEQEEEEEDGEPAQMSDDVIIVVVDENKNNKMAAVGRPRTESESSSGVSSFSSKDGQPEVREPEVPHDVIPAATEEPAIQPSSSTQEGTLVTDVTAGHSTSRERHSASENQSVTATSGEVEDTTLSKHPPVNEPAYPAGSATSIATVLVNGNPKNTSSIESRNCKKPSFEGVPKIDRNFVFCEIPLQNETSLNAQSKSEPTDPPEDDTGCKIILSEATCQPDSSSKGCLNAGFTEDDEPENDKPIITSSSSADRTKEYIPINALDHSNC